MISSQAMEIVRLYEAWVARQTGPLTPQGVRETFAEWASLTAEPDAVEFVEVQAGPTRAMWALPDGRDDGKVLLCSARRSAFRGIAES